jgi:hypothetical protein
MMDLEQNIECWKLNQRNIIVYLKLRVRELRFCLIRVQSNDDYSRHGRNWKKR